MTNIHQKLSLKFDQLLANGTNINHNHAPVLRLYGKTDDLIKPQWLLSEIDPNDPTQAFGLCDTGDGMPHLSTVSLPELSALYQVEVDADWAGHYPMEVYYQAASQYKRITLEESHLRQAARDVFYKKYGQTQTETCAGGLHSDGDTATKPLNAWKPLGPAA